jgi:hypothetical protein
MKQRLSILFVLFICCQACFSEPEITSFRPIGFKEKLWHHFGSGTGYEHNMNAYIKRHIIDGKLVLTSAEQAKFNDMLIEKLGYDSSWQPYIDKSPLLMIVIVIHIIGTIIDVIATKPRLK